MFIPPGGVGSPVCSIQLALREVLEQEVPNMLALGIIEEYNSPWCSPPVLVPKPDGFVLF